MTDSGVPESSDKAVCKSILTAEASNGFSLMELLVVIVIIGVIAAIGTPQLLGMRTRSSVRADARDLHSAYRQAQTEAVKRYVNACVELDDAAERYQITIADYFKTSLPLKELRAGIDLTKGAFLDKDGMPNPGGEPCFNRRGLPETGIGTITLSNQSLTMKVTLTPSGHVRSYIQ